MSVLYLVRHGQASVEGDDYDLLSPIGDEQCRELARTWLALGVDFDRVVIGPRRRHRQSHDAVAETFRDAGRPWPEPEHFPELDEHQGPQVLDGHRESLAPEVEMPEDGNVMKRYLRLFRLGMERWSAGELETPASMEDWRTFRSRVARGIELMCHPEQAGRRTVAFTSGGFVAAAVGTVLGLEDRRILELSFGLRNASFSELRFSAERGVGVVSVNVVPFADPALMTFI